MLACQQQYILVLHVIPKPTLPDLLLRGGDCTSSPSGTWLFRLGAEAGGGLARVCLVWEVPAEPLRL